MTLFRQGKGGAYEIGEEASTVLLEFNPPSALKTGLRAPQIALSHSLALQPQGETTVKLFGTDN